MNSHSSSAFFLSAVLHGLLVVVLLISSYAISHDIKTEPKIFELVAGEGDNFAATEAPALGVPGGIKIDIPPLPTPTPEPAPVEPEISPAPEPPPPPPSPPAPAPVVEKKPTPEADKSPATPAPDFKKEIRNQVIKAASREKMKAARERKAEQKRITQEQFQRDQATKAKKAKAQANSTLKVAKIDSAGIAKGVLGGSTANTKGGAGGKALVASGEVLDRYWALLKQRALTALRKDMPAGLSDTLIATIETYIGADGSLSRIRITESSGSDDFDRAVVAAFRKVVMPPHPNGKGEGLEMKFRTKDVEE